MKTFKLRRCLALTLSLILYFESSLLYAGVFNSNPVKPESDAACDNKLRTKLNEVKQEESRLRNKIKNVQGDLLNVQNAITNLNEKANAVSNGSSQAGTQAQSDASAKELEMVRDQTRMNSLESAIQIKKQKLTELSSRLNSETDPSVKTEIQNEINTINQELPGMESSLVEATSTFTQSRNAYEAQANGSTTTQSTSQVDPSASIKGDIGVAQIHQTTTQANLNSLNKELLLVIEERKKYEAFFEPTDFKLFDEAEEAESNPADQAMLDLLGLAAAGVALSCVPHIEAETGIPDSYTLFKSASASFISKTRNNTYDYTAKAKGLICHDLSPEIETDKQYKETKKALMHQIILTESVEKKLEIAMQSMGMYAPAYAAALKELNEKQHTIKKRKQAVKDAEAFVKKKKEEEQMAQMLMMAAAALAMMWKSNKAENDIKKQSPDSTTKAQAESAAPSIDSTTMMKIAAGAAALLFWLKKKKEREEAEKQLELRKEELEQAQYYWHLDCGAGSGGGGSNSGGGNKSSSYKTNFPWIPSLAAQSFFDRMYLERQMETETKILDLVQNILDPRAFAGVGEAKSVGLNAGTGAAQYFVQAKQQHLEQQKQAFPTPEARVNYLAGTMSMSEEAVAIMNDTLSATKRAENEYRKLLNQMAKQLKTTIQGNVSDGYNVSPSANCYTTSGGAVNTDGTCKCKTNNTCGTINSKLSTVAGPLAASGNLALQAANALMSGNAAAAEVFSVDLNKNSASLKDYSKMLEDSINKNRVEDKLFPKDFKNEGLLSKNSSRKKTFENFKKAAPLAAASSGFGADSKSGDKDSKKLEEYVSSSYGDKDWGSASYASSKSDMPNLFPSSKAAIEKTLTFSDAPAEEKEATFKNPHEGISNNSGKSIFEIISHRYVKSAYPKLFE
jgi:hypothetical protein